MFFPALGLPFLPVPGGRDGASPVFRSVGTHPHKVILQHLWQSMWSLCRLIPLPCRNTTTHSQPPTTNCHLTGKRGRHWWPFFKQKSEYNSHAALVQAWATRNSCHQKCLRLETLSYLKLDPSLSKYMQVAFEHITHDTNTQALSAMDFAPAHC